MNSEIRSSWLRSLLSAEPAGRPQAESALRDLYAAAMPAGSPPPVHFFWFDSPFQAAWAVAVLNAAHDRQTAQILKGIGATGPGQELLESSRAALCQRAQRDWEGLTPIAGDLVHAFYHRSMASRLRLYDNKLKVIHKGNEKDILYRAEQSLRLVVSHQDGQTRVPFLEYPFYVPYSFYMMAMDETTALEREAPPFLTAAWRVARSAGLWWPLRGAVVLSERPVEMHVNEKSLPHRQDGPAVLFRDGSRIWAWNGYPMREEHILHPDRIRPSVLAGLHPTFQKYVKTRARTPKPKPSAILKQDLPAASEQRIKLLRRRNHGSLPFFDRYMAGEHRKVWDDLIALGPSVREDPHAADALAVAYETMRRVSENVRTVTARLKALGYKRAFAGKFHEPPSVRTRAAIPRIEKIVEGIPLSIRAFYDVVGGVDWMGHHPAIAPLDGPVNPDPLVVMSTEFELPWCEDGERAGSLVIKPQEPDRPGSRSYEIEVPSLAADGKLIGERHDVHFVEYLRLAFRFGGFPGYDGIEPFPAELVNLSRGLVEF